MKPLSDQTLARWLRWGGWGTLSALVAVIAPAKWLGDIAEWIGVGFPGGPLTLYLARHLSLLYAMVGMLFLWISDDVARYRPLLRKLAIASIGFGLAQAAIDVSCGMPIWYTAAESISTIVGGLVLMVVVGPNRESETDQSSLASSKISR